MEEIYNVPKVITGMQKTVAKYPCISSLITHHDFNSWQKRLDSSTDLNKDLYEGPTFNLIKVLAGVALEERHPELPQYSTGLIEKMENWLNQFPQLLKDKKFPGKLKNLDRDGFMSTLSELLLAAQFRKLGFTVAFEHKFSVECRNSQPDIDLTIGDSSGELFHLEVYSPFLPAEDGFVALNDHDDAFSKKVAFKMDNKFGEKTITGLKGKVLMAVDILKVDMLTIKPQLSGSTNEDLYASMANYLPKAVDGYLFYKGNIVGDPDFVFEKLVYKK